MSEDWMTAQIVHCNAGLWRRDGYAWRGIGHTGTCSPITALPNPMTGPVTIVVDSKGRIACDLSSINSLDGKVSELIAPYIRHDKHVMTGRNCFGVECPGPGQRSVADIVAPQWYDGGGYRECDFTATDSQRIGLDWMMSATGSGTINSADGHTVRWRSL